jgi:hypothetical protein
MAKTKELIQELMKADPSGELEVVFLSPEDGWAYDADYAEKGHCNQGRVDEDNDDINCVIIK